MTDSQRAVKKAVLLAAWTFQQLLRVNIGSAYTYADSLMPRVGSLAQAHGPLESISTLQERRANGWYQDDAGAASTREWVHIMWSQDPQRLPL